MKQAVQVKCPNCQNVLRVPPDLGDASVKCKHCGYILQLRKKAAPPPPPPAARPVAPALPTASPAAQATRTAPPTALPPGVEPLPEYVPPLPTRNGAPAPLPMPQPYAAAPAPIVAPMPLIEQPAAPAPSDFNPAFELAGQRYTGRGTYKGPRGSGIGKWIAFGTVLVAGAAAVLIVLFKRDWFEKPAGNDPGKEQVKNDGKDPNNPGTSSIEPVIKIDPGKKPVAIVQAGPMPRRMLAISINNYLYLNELRFGANFATKESERKDFYKAMDRVAQGWKIPKDQFYFVSDGPAENSKVDTGHPPIKLVVEGAIDRFLGSSRPQDRVVIVFSGHAMEKDGEAYLVPLEGEFEDLATLIPLKQVYDKLAKCPAQEKLIIFDVCRYDPGRGTERPVFGVMTEALEKALHECPDGVSVLTSCSAGQYAHEYEYWQANVPGLYRLEHYGSVFMSLFFTAELKKAALSKLTSPDTPLPVGNLMDYLNEFVPVVVKELEKSEQKPKFTSKARKEWLAYNKEEPLPARVDLPKPPPTAKPTEVAAMFRELDLPPVQASIKVIDKETKLSDAFFFTEEQLRGYFEESPTFEDVQKSPEKYEKDFPLRVAVVETMMELRQLKQAESLPQMFDSPINDARKTEITNKYQRQIAAREDILRSLKEKLEEVAKNRDKEKSKRWLANYDYSYAQVRLRLAYLSEYNLALGKVKLEQLPELTDKHKGWKIAYTEKMISPKDIRDMAQEAKDALAEMVKQNPNTPWAVVARSQRGLTLGQTWVAEFKPGEKTADDK